LGANPPAKKPTVNDRKKGDKDNKRKRSKKENVKILWPEYLAEKHKFALDDVKEQHRLTIDAHERSREQKSKQEKIDVIPRFCVPAFWFFGKYPLPLSRRIYGADAIAKTFILHRIRGIGHFSF